MVSGVPQGRVLGPFLFLLHINDLPSIFSSKVRIFADDCLIYRNIKNKQDLNLLENWGNTWGMRFNVLRCNLNGCPDKLKQTAYFSLIHSFMEYGATVWDPYQKYHSNTVERVQRRAARFVKSRYTRYSSFSDMPNEFGWLPLSQRRKEAGLILFYKIINGLAQVPFVCVLIETYKSTRRKHNMKFRYIGHTTSQLLVHGPSLLSLKICH